MVEVGSRDGSIGQSLLNGLVKLSRSLVGRTEVSQSDVVVVDADGESSDMSKDPEVANTVGIPRCRRFESGVLKKSGRKRGESVKRTTNKKKSRVVCISYIHLNQVYKFNIVDN